MELAGGDLLPGCALIAKLANPDSLLGSHRRSEYAAGHGTRRVEIASTGFRIKHGTRFVVRVIFEGWVIEAVGGPVKDSRGNISGKIRTQAADRIASPCAHAFRTIRITLIKFRHAFFEPEDIELADGENSHAALITTQMAGQPCTTPAGGVSERGVHDLHQLSISGKQRFRSAHSKSYHA
jgi:hypothetical protein